MKKLLPLLCGVLVSSFCFSQTTQHDIAIIPEPVSVTKNSGTFTLPQQISIAAGAADSIKPVITYLSDHLAKPTGYSVTAGASSTNAAIKLVLNRKADAALGREGYRLSVTPDNVTLTANAAAGLFYGVQTLLQLFPKDIESDSTVSNVKWEAPCVDITDYPRFGWRGLMFDVSRHFFGKEDVKRFIVDMVRYKFNLLHMHLTDDEGWRIEIKS